MEGTGVRMVSWPRDRLGMLKPFQPANAQVISCPIQVVSGRPKLYANVSGLGKNSQLRVSLMDEGFRPLPGYSGNEAAILAEDGFRVPVVWKTGDFLPSSPNLVRAEIRFDGVRPEDAAVHAAYIGQ